MDEVFFVANKDDYGDSILAWEEGAFESRDECQKVVDSWNRSYATPPPFYVLPVKVNKKGVNAHEELVNALERVLDVITGDQAAELGIYDALAKARQDKI